MGSADSPTASEIGGSGTLASLKIELEGTTLKVQSDSSKGYSVFEFTN